MPSSIVTLTGNTEYTGLQSIPGTTATYNIQGLSKHFGIDENTPESSPGVSGKGKTHTSADNCGKFAIYTEDLSGKHQFAKVLICGREWCPKCGTYLSNAHNRRICRLLRKYQQIESAGRIVIEWPIEYRKDKNRLYSKAGLQETSKIITRTLGGKHGRNGRTGGYFDRGLGRWHFYGDYYGLINGYECDMEYIPDRYGESFKKLVVKLQQLGIADIVINDNKKTLYIDNPGGEHALEIQRLVLRFTKAYRLKIKPYFSIEWNPHFNVTVDGEYLEPERLEEIKTALRNALDCKDLIVNYGYMTEPGQIYHWLKYTTRATFRDYRWNPYMAAQLYNFRNCRWWGHWDDPPVWVLDKDIEAEAEAIQAAERLGSGYCPECGEELKPWTQPISSKWLDIWQAEEYGDTGYYKIENTRSFDGEVFSIERLMLLNDLALNRPELCECIHGNKQEKLETRMNNIINTMEYFRGEDWYREDVKSISI